MTQHSSLKAASVEVKHRNVLKRHERIKALQKDEKWNDRSSVYKLPKMKLLKIKVKKVKAKAEETQAEGSPTAVPQATGAPAKTQPAAKPISKPVAKPTAK